MIFFFLAVLHVLECAFLIFYVFECFSPYSISNSVCVLFSTFWRFLTIFTSYSVHFSLFTFFTVSSHIRGPTMMISHFPRISVFLAIFQVIVFVSHFPLFFFFSFPAFINFLECAFIHIPSQIVFMSYFPRFSVFSPYSRSYSVCVSFSMFFSFLPILQVLQ